MDAADLRVFETVARLGGMNRAAAELNTVQSNVTARIRALEDELGAALFHRHSRGVDLTPAGRRLLPYASKVGALLVEARRAVSDDGEPKGPLTIGSLETTAAHRLSPILARFGLAHPLVDLTVRIGTNDRLLEQVLAGELDAAFVCGPINSSALAGDVIFREELVIATAPTEANLDEILSGGAKILVKPAGCAYRERLEGFLAGRGVREVGCMEFGTIEAIISCVAAGLGLTMLPRSVLATAEAAGRVRLHRLSGGKSVVDTVLIRRREAFELSALRSFRALALQQHSS